MGLKTQKRMTKSNTSTAFITWKHTNMNLYYENDQSQAKVLMPLVLERTSTHILNLIIYIGWWQKRATGAGYFKAETKNYWSVYKHAVVKYQNRCGLCKHPLGQGGELTELHRIKPGAEGGKYVVWLSLIKIPVHKFCHIKNHANAAKETVRFDPYRYLHIIILNF